MASSTLCCIGCIVHDSSARHPCPSSTPSARFVTRPMSVGSMVPDRTALPPSGQECDGRAHPFLLAGAG